MKNNFSYEINNKLNDYENQIIEQTAQIGLL